MNIKNNQQQVGNKRVADGATFGKFKKFQNSRVSNWKANESAVEFWFDELIVLST